MISVFGASGFVGQHFVNRFPTKVVAEPRNALEPSTPEVLFFISTVDNYNVFSNPFIDIETNQVHTIRVLDAARKKFGEDVVFNFISTWFVYGDTPLPARESSPCFPKGFYPITRLAAEQLVISYCLTYNIRYRILRLSNMIGVGDRKASNKKNAIVHLIQKIASGENPAIYEEPSFRDILDVRDGVSAIGLVTDSGKYNEIYNIGSGKPTNVMKLLESVNIKYGNGKLQYIPVPKFHKQVQVQDFYMDVEKLMELGFIQRYTLEDTVEWIINEYRTG